MVLIGAVLLAQLAGCSPDVVSDQSPDVDTGPSSDINSIEFNSIKFGSPVRVEVDGKPMNVEGSGYACPSLADLNGDGLKDLLVGQLANGRIKVYHNDGQQGFRAGEWLQAEGSPVELPEVW